MKLLPILAIALLLVSCGVPAQNATTDTSSDSSAPTQQTTKTITMAQYNQVKEGMSLAEVEAILGKGKEVSSSEITGIQTALYTWQNPDFSNLTVTIQNGVVVSKAQLNLK